MHGNVPGFDKGKKHALGYTSTKANTPVFKRDYYWYKIYTPRNSHNMSIGIFILRVQGYLLLESPWRKFRSKRWSMKHKDVPSRRIRKKITTVLVPACMKLLRTISCTKERACGFPFPPRFLWLDSFYFFYAFIYLAPTCGMQNDLPPNLPFRRLTRYMVYVSLSLFTSLSLVGGWTNPFQKYESNWIIPQGSGVK